MSSSSPVSEGPNNSGLGRIGRRRPATSADMGHKGQSNAPISSKSSLLLALGCLLVGIIGTQTVILIFGLHEDTHQAMYSKDADADTRPSSGSLPENADHRDTSSLRSKQHAADHRQRVAGEELFKTSTSGAESWGEEKKTEPIPVNALAPRKDAPPLPAYQRNRPKDHKPPTTSLGVAHASDYQHLVDPEKLNNADKLKAVAMDVEVPESCRRSPTLLKTFEDPMKRLAKAALPDWPSDPVSDRINWLKPDTDQCSLFFGPGFTGVKEVIPPSALKKPFDDSYLPSNLRGQSQDDSDPGEVLLKIPGPQDTSYPRTPLQCAYSESLRDSICIANNIMVDTNKLGVSCGGEPVEEVKGRDESQEFPTVVQGSMQVLVDETYPERRLGELSSLVTHENSKILTGIETVHAVELVQCVAGFSNTRATENAGHYSRWPLAQYFRRHVAQGVAIHGLREAFQQEGLLPSGRFRPKWLYLSSYSRSGFQEKLPPKSFRQELRPPIYTVDGR
eukprot:gb/GECG01002941.1/.p1 GENE.gb/GECG01002941.1/~~gb/GECG01002941.1/.p1  ORF type:complete len:506 (+),score=54.93 gb/GECG01002941.1/:1-1518(+)